MDGDPVLDSVDLNNNSYVLKWHMPDGIDSPDGGFDFIIDGTDTNQINRVGSLTRSKTINGLDISLVHSFRLQGRGGTSGNRVFYNSNTIYYDPNAIVNDSPNSIEVEATLASSVIVSGDLTSEDNLPLPVEYVISDVEIEINTTLKADIEMQGDTIKKIIIKGV